MVATNQLDDISADPYLLQRGPASGLFSQSTSTH